MKKAILMFLAISFIFFSAGCTDIKKYGEIRFFNDTVDDFYGVRFGDAEAVPFNAGDTTAYMDVEEGTHPVEMLNSSNEWDTVYDALKIGEGAKGTIRFYKVGTTLYLATTNDKSAAEGSVIDKSAGDDPETVATGNDIRIEIDSAEFIKK